MLCQVRSSLLKGSIKLDPSTHKILLLAPQPFFQERGTPIAIKLLLESLSSAKGVEVNLLSYNVGDEIEIPNVRHRRMWAPKGLTEYCFRPIRPGISWRKLVADFFFSLSFFTFPKLRQMSLVHAVEEGIFLAYICKKFFGIPYIYDMDSSLVAQLVERWSWCRFLLAPMLWLEKVAVRNSDMVVAVCPKLCESARALGAKRVELLPDVALFENIHGEMASDLRQELALDRETPLVLYVGNLEEYQGIDLLVESFQLVLSRYMKSKKKAALVIVGGSSEHVRQYRTKYPDWIEKGIYFVGPRPFRQLGGLLAQASVVVSPRTKGTNTPMKIYNYLASGCPLVATKLETHTQVITSQEAMLCEPTSEDLARGIEIVLEDGDLANSLATAARELVLRSYTKDAFQRRLSRIYGALGITLHSMSTAQESANR